MKINSFSLLGVQIPLNVQFLAGQFSWQPSSIIACRFLTYSRRNRFLSMPQEILPIWSLLLKLRCLSKWLSDHLQHRSNLWWLCKICPFGISRIRMTITFRVSFQFLSWKSIWEKSMYWRPATSNWAHIQIRRIYIYPFNCIKYNVVT